MYVVVVFFLINIEFNIVKYYILILIIVECINFFGEADFFFTLNFVKYME